MSRTHPADPSSPRPVSDAGRRSFLKASASLAAAGLASGSALPAFGRLGVHNGAGTLKVGLIGCGGRGTGAASDLLTASPDARVVAMADMFADRLDGSLGYLSKLGNGLGERVEVPRDRRFTGFDAYKALLATDVDVVILATPPGFRPAHMSAAVNAGKHVFFEKPVAVDPAGVRMVIEAAQKAQQAKLTVVTGTQRRHEKSYLAAIEQVQSGAIGKVLAARCYWNQGGLWMHQRQDEWSDMEWQLRNWLYFTWLSGDHICEQHVHNLDVVNWVMGGPPSRAMGMGGRQVRTGPEYGHIFDHFAVEYEYPSGAQATSFCRQIDGCASRVDETFQGEKGTMITSPGTASIRGAAKWDFRGDNPNPYVQEHRDLVASITGSGPYLNEGVRVAESTLTAIMGRMSAYTGKVVTWEQALNSKLNLMPATLALGSIQTPEVAIPGRTPLI